MNKKTVALTKEQCLEIITTMQEGFPEDKERGIAEFKPNKRAAMALMLEANLGLRISDILDLRLSDIIRDGARYRLDIVEKKTGKDRNFTVPAEIYQWLENYCLRNEIGKNELIFPVRERGIQKQLKLVCDYLGYERISTHSFRKFYATAIYESSGYNIELVRQLLQHSSVKTTQRYIGIQPEVVEGAIRNHMLLI